MTEQNKSAKLNRRQILSFGAVSGLAVGLNASTGTQAKAKTMPRLELAKLSELEPGSEIDFSYPDEDSPAILLALDGPVEDGVGPNQNIIAYSVLCTHKGCPVSWYHEQQMLICPCHWSSFDPAKKGRIVIGQASQSLPQITLKVEGGAVHATGISGLIYGRQTNVL
jgi:arsenite oxidase small subunit